MATPSTILDAVATQIDTAVAGTRSAHDVLRRVRAVRDLMGQDRHYLLRPGLVEAIEWIGTDWRRFALDLAITYTATADAYDRVADDSELVTTVVEGLGSAVSAIREADLESVEIDDSSVDGQVIATWHISIVYAKGA